MFAPRRIIARNIRVLFSEPSFDSIRECVAQLIHRTCPNHNVVVTMVPSGIREDQLLETAVKAKFDIAILVLNNIFYAPYDLDTRGATLAADGVSLVRRMVSAFDMPVIALYGHPNDPWHVRTLLRVGATAAMKLPFKPEEMEQALRISLLGSHQN